MLYELASRIHCGFTDFNQTILSVSQFHLEVLADHGASGRLLKTNLLILTLTAPTHLRVPAPTVPTMAFFFICFGPYRKRHILSLPIRFLRRCR